MMPTIKSYKLIASLLFAVFTILSGCRHDNTPVDIKKKLSTEQLMDINRQLVTKDRERIESYIERKNLSMMETETGLWYQVIEKGSGTPIKEGSKITVKYRCYLLDGSLCYDSERDGDLKITIGSSEIPAGLDEGLRMLTYGSSAIFIVPSYLGFGLMGDGNHIPARAVLNYEVEVME